MSCRATSAKRHHLPERKLIQPFCFRRRVPLVQFNAERNAQVVTYQPVRIHFPPDLVLLRRRFLPPIVIFRPPSSRSFYRSNPTAPHAPPSHPPRPASAPPSAPYSAQSSSTSKCDGAASAYHSHCSAPDPFGPSTPYSRHAWTCASATLSSSALLGATHPTATTRSMWWRTSRVEEVALRVRVLVRMALKKTMGERGGWVDGSRPGWFCGA